MANRNAHPDRDWMRVAEHECSPEWFGRDPVEWAGELMRTRMRVEACGGCSNVDVSLTCAEHGARTWQPELAR